MGESNNAPPDASAPEQPRVLTGFATDYALYRELLAEMDRVPSLAGKRDLFRRLTALLDRLEGGIWSAAWESLT